MIYRQADRHVGRMVCFFVVWVYWVAKHTLSHKHACIATRAHASAHVAAAPLFATLSALVIRKARMVAIRMPSGAVRANAPISPKP